MTVQDDITADSTMGRRLVLAFGYRRLTMRGKSAQITIIAIARELVAFIWEMARAVPMTT
jgi:hypothetical protein